MSFLISLEAWTCAWLFERHHMHFLQVERCFLQGFTMTKKKAKPRIPVNIIAGPLGVGKTTMINHLLETRPDGERWAVLVNEYGMVGLDAALMESPDQPGGRAGVEVREVAGGCICCSAGFLFEVSLSLLLQRRPQRLLIEPTGLAALSGILDVLERPGFREAVDVRSIVCILNPGRLKEDLERENVADQVEAADVILASKPDLATPQELESFEAWSGSLFPPKRHVGQVEQGAIPLAFLNLMSGRTEAPGRGGHRHGTDHEPGHGARTHTSEDTGEKALDSASTQLRCDASRPIVEVSHRSSMATTAGWVCWAGLEFDAKRSSEWLNELARLPGALRTKAVLRTNEGWWSFNFADGMEDVRPSGYRRDSRIEFIFEGDPGRTIDGLEGELRACLRQTPKPEDAAS